MKLTYEIKKKTNLLHLKGNSDVKMGILRPEFMSPWYMHLSVSLIL